MALLAPKRIEGGSSFENPYRTLRHRASVPAIPPLRAAFRMFGHLRQHLQHVLKGVSRRAAGMDL